MQSELTYAAQLAANLSVRPSEYWQRQCYAGASFLHPAETSIRDRIGVDKIMWGSDYPHRESSYPFSNEALRLSFAGIDPVEVQQMLGGNAARLFGFDIDSLAQVARRVGPTHEEIARPLEPAEIPDEAGRCPAFGDRPPGPWPGGSWPARPLSPLVTHTPSSAVGSGDCALTRALATRCSIAAC